MNFTELERRCHVIAKVQQHVPEDVLIQVLKLTTCLYGLRLWMLQLQCIT